MAAAVIDVIFNLIVLPLLFCLCCAAAERQVFCLSMLGGQLFAFTTSGFYAVLGHLVTLFGHRGRVACPMIGARKWI